MDIKIKKFCASKDTIKKLKRQSKAWEKMFSIHVSDERLVSRTYEYDHNSIKRQIIQKWAKEPAALFLSAKIWKKPRCPSVSE